MDNGHSSLKVDQTVRKDLHNKELNRIKNTIHKNTHFLVSIFVFYMAL